MVSSATHTVLDSTLNVLHLSDLHFGHPAPTSRWNQRIVLTRLENALAEEGRRFALIVVTGDIAYHGRSGEYDDAAEWLISLASSIGVQQDMIFCVPGNHDVDRSVCEAGRALAYLQALRENRNQSVDGGRDSGELGALTDERFAGYHEFATRFAPECANLYGWQSILKVETGAVRRVEHATGEPGTIRLLGLNTALLAQEDDARKLRMGLRTATELGLFDRRSKGLRLVLSHHPISSGDEQWLADEEVRDYATAVDSADVYMCGHVHEADARSVTSSNGSTCRLIAGALYAPDTSPHTGDVPVSHSYSRLTLSHAHSHKWWLELAPEKWSAARREFQPDHDLVGARHVTRRFYFPPDLESDLSSSRNLVAEGHADLTFKPWLRYIPKRVFGPSDAGFNSDFLAHFNRHMARTDFYYYRGGSGRVTSVQVGRLLDTQPDLRHVSLLLCAPEPRPLRRRLKLESPAQPPSDERIALERHELYCSLVGLDRIVRDLERNNVEIQVAFYHEDVHYRVELTQKAAYLTYYGQGGSHGATVYYPADVPPPDDEYSSIASISMHRTHLEAFESSFAYAKEELYFRSMAGRGLVAVESTDDGSIVENALVSYIERVSDHSIPFYVDQWEQRLKDLSGELE